MISIGWLDELVKWDKKLQRIHKKVSAKARAQSANVAARAVRKSARKIINNKVGLPVKHMNKRTSVLTADARKPVIAAKARGYIGQDKFSASYRPKDTKQMIALQIRGGVEVGKHKFTGGFITKSKHGRPYIARRVGHKRKRLIFPNVRVGETIHRSVLSQDKMGARIFEKELAARWEKGIKKAMAGL